MQILSKMYEEMFKILGHSEYVKFVQMVLPHSEPLLLWHPLAGATTPRPCFFKKKKTFSRAAAHWLTLTIQISIHHHQL